MKKVYVFILCIPFIIGVFSSNLIGNQQNNERFMNLVDIPRLTMDIPEVPRPWDMDVSVLRDSIAAHDGKAMIGLKAPGSDRMVHNNGIREALTAEQFRAALEMIDRMDIEILKIYRTFGAASVRMNPDDVYVLFDHPMVDYIEIPMKFYLDSYLLIIGTSIMSSGSQVIPWGISMVRAPISWHETTGTGSRIMIIDTGMENHIDLPDRPTSNCGGIYDGCSDGPIYHGTHVSGIAMALNNDIGVVGVAPGLANDAVFSWGGCSPYTATCHWDNIAEGIDAANLANIDVINMSFGRSTIHTGISNAVAAAWDGGAVMVASAGNIPPWGQGGSVRYPAGHSEVIGVSGVKDDGTFADTSPCDGWKSNHGPHVDISAPFWALSTVGTYDYENENQGWCGTSLAAPHVTGAAALLRAQNPLWSNQQIVDRLLNTANHPTSSTRDYYYGYGIVDVAEALDVSPPTAPFITLDASGMNPKLNWNTVSVADSYNIYYGSIQGAPGTVSCSMVSHYWKIGSTTLTTYTDHSVWIDPNSDILACYYVTSVNQIGESNPSNKVGVHGMAPLKEAELITAETISLPEEFAIFDNYPNPFNPVTTIRYNIPEPSTVSLIIYDITGREVRRLVDGTVEPGYHTAVWDGTGISGTTVSSGVYIYRFTAVPANDSSHEGITTVRKMVFTK